MQLQNALLRPCCALRLPALSPCLRSRVHRADCRPEPKQVGLNGPSERSCWLLVFRPGRRDIQLSTDLVDSARIAIALTGCALVKRLGVVIASRRTAGLRCFCTLRIGLLHDCSDIGWIGCALRHTLRELLVCENERGWAPEDGECYEAMTDLSHRRTSDLYDQGKVNRCISKWKST
jgi:hypothetical protein